MPKINFLNQEREIDYTLITFVGFLLKKLREIGKNCQNSVWFEQKIASLMETKFDSFPKTKNW